MAKAHTIHIVFYCGIEKNFATSKILLEDLMQELFGSSQKCVFDSERAREIIFSIVTPATKNEIPPFFENLKHLFVSTSLYNPHFTQHATPEDNLS